METVRERKKSRDLPCPEKTTQVKRHSLLLVAAGNWAFKTLWQKVESSSTNVCSLFHASQVETILQAHREEREKARRKRWARGRREKEKHPRTRRGRWRIIAQHIKILTQEATHDHEWRQIFQCDYTNYGILLLKY